MPQGDLNNNVTTPKLMTKNMPTCVFDELLPLLSILYVDDQMLRGIQI